MSELKYYPACITTPKGKFSFPNVYLKSEADKVIAELKEKCRWRKFNEEKPSEEMEGEDFLVSNGYYSVVCEWRGYWNNEPFCGDKNCDVVRYWMTIPSTPKED